MSSRPHIVIFGLVLMALTATGLWWGYRQWYSPVSPPAKEAEHAALPPGVTLPVKLSPQARKNLGLVSKPLQPTTYWRTIELPGVVVDRPGVSDRGVIAPVTGVVTQIFSHPGETVEANSPLVTLRLTSESLHNSQRELFKSSQEIEIARQRKERLAGLAESGAIARARIIEIDNEIQRLDASVNAYRQELLARGLSEKQIEAIATGQFVKEITVRAPSESPRQPAETLAFSGEDEHPVRPPFKFEFEDLEVALGQQAEAGQVLCHLADHRSLLIEGHGFKDDMPLVQLAAKEGYPIEIEFESERNAIDWPPAPTRLRIHHIENVIDPQTRTFGFHLVLENQWQTYQQGDHTGLLWRFRPGDRVRLKAAVEKVDNVFVVPQQAIVREGPEAFVFRQNGDLFERKPVHVLHEDRLNAVLASDGSVRPGFYIAQSGAAAINRVMKAQSSSGAPPGFHVHADGTVHGSH